MINHLIDCIFEFFFRAYTMYRKHNSNMNDEYIMDFELYIYKFGKKKKSVKTRPRQRPIPKRRYIESITLRPISRFSLTRTSPKSRVILVILYSSL